MRLGGQDEVADGWRGEEAREGEDVGDCVDVFVRCEGLEGLDWVLEGRGMGRWRC